MVDDPTKLAGVYEGGDIYAGQEDSASPALGGGVTRETLDTAGGIILTPDQDFVYVNNKLAAVIGTYVQSHYPCGDDSPEHCHAYMQTGSSFTYINNVPVCRENDIASCGHVATGSSNVFINA